MIQTELTIIEKRESYSKKRIKELSKKLSEIKELENFEGLTIFGAGSYGRLEASEYSDIDMFFLCNNSRSQIFEPNINKIRLFARIINTVEDLKFPKFSNDGEFLKLLHLDEMVKKLGGQNDDYENHFTTRMLLLLESKCLYKREIYKESIERIVNSYFRDYPKHKKNFKPLFIINDIARYWKTLCLNYEHKRNQRIDSSIVESDEQKVKVKQKVKNFKLKISRMTTCFATIAALSCQLESITEKDVIEMVELTPRQRLQKISEFIPSSKSKIDELICEYEWFLEMTGLSTEKLHAHFENKEKRTIMFSRANKFGDMMYDLLNLVDGEYEIFRYLVI